MKAHVAPWFVVASTVALATTAGGGCGSTTSQAPAKTGETETSMPVSSTQANKTLVLEALDATMVRHDLAAIDRYFAEPYRQHNPHVPNGLEPLRGLVQGLAQNPDFQYERFRVIADGDLVAVHGRYTGWLPQPVIVVDLFRLEGGKIVEHWDGVQPESGPNPSGHTMVDGPTEIAQVEHTDKNRARISDFLNAILVRGEMDRLPGFFDGDNYTQHNPMVADGLSGLGAFMKTLQERGIAMRYHRVHRVVAEGNFVVSQSEGEFGGKRQAFYDIFRVENGKIAEHWDVIQEVPEKTASGLGMF